MINMTHCNDDGVQIKVEPISPPEVAGTMEVPMDFCQGGVPSPPLEAAPLMCGSPAQWQLTPTHAAMPMERGVKVEQGGILRTSSGTRKALKNKIQSGRRARGQEELVVKFEPQANCELTEIEIKKRERRKEQNRRAAQKCRVKKRQLQSIALQQYDSLVQQNGDLQIETTNLKKEVRRLKFLLQEHENSGLCKLVNVSQSQSAPQTDYQKLATATAPFNYSLSQPTESDPDALASSEELRKQASIEKIVKDLEMITPQALQPHSTQFAQQGTDDPLASLPDTHETVMSFDDLEEYLQNLSRTDDGFPCIDTTDNVIKDTPADNPPKEEEGQFWGNVHNTILVAQNNKQCAVRNLNEDFARCANQDFTPTETINSQSPAPITINNNNNNLPPSLNLEELRNRDSLQAIPVFDGRFFNSSNELSPISSYSSCTSPPSNLTSPSFFPSPAERHRCSPDTAAFPQVPNVFRFPPDARFSPSS